MNKYEIILEALQYQLDEGYLTIEEAEEVNNLAYNRYIVEREIDYIASSYQDNDYTKKVRKVEILKMKLKHKKITQQEFDNELKKINSTIKEEDEVPKIQPSGIKLTNYSRPNKERPQDLSKNIKRHDGCASTYIQGKDSVETTRDKLKHHYKICKVTDNYNEYKQHYHELEKLLSVSDTSAILNMHGGNFRVFKQKKADLPEGSVLFHTSTQKGITRLNGTFRAKDNVIYSTKRVYFTVGRPGSRYGGSGSGLGRDEYCYQYIGDVSKAMLDNELTGGKAVYIETNTSLPVKDITSEFRK